jgi:hypothetical protein
VSATSAALPSQAPRYRDDTWELRCRTCGDWWPLTLDFYEPRHGTARCKACWREHHRRYEQGRRTDADFLIGKRAADRLKHRANPTVKREAARRWRQANREHVIAYRREWTARQKGQAA